jgi:hypothetical protein
MPNEIKFDTSGMAWTQVVQNKRGEIEGGRSVNLPPLDADSSYAAVESFAQFVEKSGGDVEISVLSALDDLRQIAKNWMAKVDKGESEADISLAGSQLKQLTELYKAVDLYYEINFPAAAVGD